MNIPDNLVVVESFEGHSKNRGIKANKILNNYYLVYDKDDVTKKNFYIMFCSDNSYFYFSVNHIDNIVNNTWFISNNYVTTCVKRVNLYLHELIFNIDNKETHAINHINGNKMDNRDENLESITIEKKKFSINSGKKKNYDELFEILNIDKFPKYVSYYKEMLNESTGNCKDYFIIRHHPILDGKKWKSSSSKKIDIKIRYQQTIEKLEELNNLVK